MKGRRQYERFMNGLSLTPKQAILAQCYICNGESEGGHDCLGANCPLYQFMPYNPHRSKKRELTEEERKAIRERLRKGIESGFRDVVVPIQ